MVRKLGELGCSQLLRPWKHVLRPRNGRGKFLSLCQYGVTSFQPDTRFHIPLWSKSYCPIQPICIGSNMDYFGLEKAMKLQELRNFLKAQVKLPKPNWQACVWPGFAQERRRVWRQRRGASAEGETVWSKMHCQTKKQITNLGDKTGFFREKGQFFSLCRRWSWKTDKWEQVFTLMAP